MTKNQFFYTRKELAPIQKEGADPIYRTFRDSLNTQKIIRSVELEDGRVLILLDDIHQRPIEVEVKNKQGKVTAIKKETQVFQSEIYLTDPNDIKRFIELTSIEPSK